MKIELAIPTTGQICAQLAVRMVDWKRELGDKIGIHARIAKPVDRNRNEIIEEFLKRDADILWMIDDDIIPPRKAWMMAEKMRGGVKVCGAVCWIWMGHSVMSTVLSRVGYDAEYGVPHYAPVAKKILKPAADKKEMVQVDATGCGCIMIHREVLEKVGPNPFTIIHKENGGWVTGEDIRFCEKAKDAGYDLWVDTTYICDHLQSRISLARIQEYAGMMAKELSSDQT